MAYKLPRKESNSLLDGYRYLYMNERRQGFIVSESSLRSGDRSAVENTLNQVYEDKAPMHIMYNDQYSGAHVISTSYGHTKGVLAFDSDSGFWIVHSVPHFPNVKAKGYGYPDSSTKNGQMILCLSFSIEEFGPIVAQLLFRQIYAYETEGLSSTAIRRMMPVQHQSVIVQMLNEIRTRNVTVSKSKAIEHLYPIGSAFPAVYATMTSGKQRVLMFAKTSAFGAHFYRWLAQALKVKKLMVQSWQNPPGGIMPSYCPAQWREFVTTINAFQPEVENIKELRLERFVPLLPPINTSNDLSKWAVGEGTWRTENGAYTCIGDLNRMVSLVAW